MSSSPMRTLYICGARPQLGRINSLAVLAITPKPHADREVLLILVGGTTVAVVGEVDSVEACLYAGGRTPEPPAIALLGGRS